MKAIATELEGRLTYLKRELVRLQNSAWWAMRDDRPEHPMVVRTHERMQEIAREIQSLAGGTSHAG